MPETEIKKFLNKNGEKVCLFCDYADEVAVDYIEREKMALKRNFDKIVALTPDFDFKQKFDCVFFSGGNIFELIYKLKKYKQFDKFKKMIEKDVLMIGNSAGSELFAKDNLYVAQYEPPQIEMDIKKNCEGFGVVPKVVVHASKYRLSARHGLIFDKGGWHDYMKYKIKEKDGIKIANNAVLIVTEDGQKLKKYSWQKLVALENRQKIVQN